MTKQNLNAEDRQPVERRMLTEREAVRYIGMSRSYLAKARCEGNLPGRTPGPKYCKIGRAIRYDIHDLDAWIDAHKYGAGRN